MSFSGLEKKLVEVLKQNTGRYLGEDELLNDFGLCDTLESSTEAGCDIQRALEVLRLQGYSFDGDEVHGWRLTGLPDMLHSLEVENCLESSFLGKCLFTYRIIGSTNATARLLAENGAPDGSLILAEEQNLGRGRRSNAWFSPAGGGIWASLILRPGIQPAHLGSLGMLTALSICLAIEEKTGLKPRIKWPNDVFLDGLKVAGILCESGISGSRLKYVVLGIGLNVNLTEFPAELEGKATSLSLATGGGRFDRLSLLQALMINLEDGYFKLLADGFASFLPRVQVRDYLKDRQVSVECPDGTRVVGRAGGIDQTGELILEPESGEALLRIADGHVLTY